MSDFAETSNVASTNHLKNVQYCTKCAKPFTWLGPVEVRKTAGHGLT